MVYGGLLCVDKVSLCYSAVSMSNRQFYSEMFQCVAKVYGVGVDFRFMACAGLLYTFNFENVQSVSSVVVFYNMVFFSDLLVLSCIFVSCFFFIFRFMNIACYRQFHLYKNLVHVITS